jgi:uncharacterized protein DUF72
MREPIVLHELVRRTRTDYRIGLSAWTDKSMIEDGRFYPYKTMSAEERLWWYSRFFDVVEVNSTFYALRRLIRPRSGSSGLHPASSST